MRALPGSPKSPAPKVPTVLLGPRQRVVFDTSTLVSVCLFPNRRPAKALRISVTEHNVCCSKETLAELVTVLRREKFERWRPESERAKFIEEFLRVITLVAITKIGTGCRDADSGCRDAADNKCLSLALSAHASIIVSSDPDLLVMHPFQGVAIVDPKPDKPETLQLDCGSGSTAMRISDSSQSRWNRSHKGSRAF